MSQPLTASFKDFARIARVRASYVSQLKAEGRLVLTETGKAVRVAESLALILATRDPAKAAVAARHEAARTAKVGEGAGGAPIAAPGATAAADAGAGEDPPGADEADSRDTGYQHWRTRNERAKALASERDNAQAEGKLLAAADVEAAIAAAATQLRTRLESLPAILGPQLVAITDEAQLIATLAETIEHTLEELSRQFAAIGRGATDAAA